MAVLRDCLLTDETHFGSFRMFRWLFGSSEETVEAPSERVDEIMEEAHIVKDFYNR